MFNILFILTKLDFISIEFNFKLNYISIILALNINYVSKQSSIQNGTPKEFQSDSFESNYFRKISYGQIINSKYSYFLALAVASRRQGKGC